MTSNINFIEVIPEENCYYCGRRKIKEDDKFYKILIGDNTFDVAVCEFCKGGFTGNILEDATKSYAPHFAFYITHALSEQG